MGHINRLHSNKCNVFLFIESLKACLSVIFLLYYGYTKGYQRMIIEFIYTEFEINRNNLQTKILRILLFATFETILFRFSSLLKKCIPWLIVQIVVVFKFSFARAYSFASINMIIKVFFSKQRPAFWIYKHINTHPVVNKTLWFITHRLGVQLPVISIYTPSINEIIEATTYFICLEKRNHTNVFECLVNSTI